MMSRPRSAFAVASCLFVARPLYQAACLLWALQLRGLRSDVVDSSDPGH